MNDNLAGRGTEQLPQAFVEVEFACGKIETRALRFPGIDLLIQRQLRISCRHNLLQIPVSGRTAMPDSGLAPNLLSLGYAAFYVKPSAIGLNGMVPPFNRANYTGFRERF
jgi:hypothetical protein